MNEVYININDINSSFTRHLFQNEFNKDIISIEELISYIEDLFSQVESLQEEFNKLQQDLEDNYISRPMSDYTGDSYDDRF